MSLIQVDHTFAAKKKGLKVGVVRIAADDSGLGIEFNEDLDSYLSEFKKKFNATDEHQDKVRNFPRGPIELTERKEDRINPVHRGE